MRPFSSVLNPVGWIVLASISGLLGTGCGIESRPPSGPVAKPNAAVLRASPHSIHLQVNLHDETDANILYRIERDGTFNWGGGLNALIDKTTWAGQMTDDERRQLYDLLITHGWFERDPVSTNVPEGSVTRVDLSGDAGSNHFKVRGQNADVQPVLDLLDRISRRRLEPDLQMLPQPGLQKR